MGSFQSKYNDEDEYEHHGLPETLPELFRYMACELTPDAEADAEISSAPSSARSANFSSGFEANLVKKGRSKRGEGNLVPTDSVLISTPTPANKLAPTDSILIPNSLPEASRQASRPQAQRPVFKTGDQIEMWSKSQQTWVTGNVEKAEGPWLHISYSNAEGQAMTKIMPNGHEELRAVGSSQGNEPPTTIALSPQQLAQSRSPGHPPTPSVGTPGGAFANLPGLDMASLRMTPQGLSPYGLSSFNSPAPQSVSLQAGATASPCAAPQSPAPAPAPAAQTPTTTPSRQKYVEPEVHNRVPLAAGVEKIEPEVVQQMLQNGQCVLIDVRGDDRSVGLIPGSVHVQAIDSIPFLQKIPGLLQQYANMPVVVFTCQYSAHRAPQCANWYREQANAGQRVAILSGGFRGWEGNGLPVESSGSGDKYAADAYALLQGVQFAHTGAQASAMFKRV